MLRGGSGSDYIDGHYGNDYIYGGLDDDAASFTTKAGLHGDSPSMKADSSKDGDDRIYGQSGSDSLYGYGGSDLLVGGAGREDLIIATEERFPPDADGGASPVPSKNPGEDIVRGGAGTDHIYARDGYKDTIDCGDGVDSVVFDKGLDKVASNCEQKNIDS
jgi:Ca2+-binding RTX toxin-like protein